MDPTTPHDPAMPIRLDRRALLARLAGVAAIGAPLSAAVLSGCVERIARLSAAPPPSRLAGRVLSREEWRTLEAALDRLLPSEPGAPGAKDVDAIGYLDATLASPDVEGPDPARVRTAARRLDAIAVERGVASYADLAVPARDEVLLALQKADAEGLRCVERLLYYALEAFLGDPVHGGNKGEVAWTWLGHVPGEPRLRRRKDGPSR